MGDAARAVEQRAEAETSALQQLQAHAGLAEKRKERLDWMYEQTSAPVQDDLEKMNTALEPGAAEDIEQVKKLESTSGSLFLRSSTKTTEDTLRKLREDPLFQIRQQEHRAKQDALSNPLIVDRLRRKAEKVSKKEKKAQKKAKKKEKKAAKKAKKAAKKAKKAAGSSSSSSSSGSSIASPGVAAARQAPAGRQPSPPHRKSAPWAQAPRQAPEDLRHLGPDAAIMGAREEFRQRQLQQKEAALASRGAPRQMSEAEKRRRLDEMKADAATHESSKDARIAASEQKEKEIEAMEAKMRQSKDQKVFKEMRSKAYLDSGNSVADRLGNQRHRRQRDIIDPLERDT